VRSSPKDETPHRVNRVRPLVDHQVDRTHVEAQQCVELSVTNGRGLAPRSLSSSSRQDPRSLQDRLMVVCSTTRGHASLAWRPIGPGGESGVVPPVPMPNTAVKRSSAHDTGVTKPRENRPVPGPFGRHTSTRALKDSFAVFSFAVVLFMCYSHTAILKLGRRACCFIYVLFAQGFSRAGSSSALRSREVWATRAVP
jgi:hypothetical protein